MYRIALIAVLGTAAFAQTEVAPAEKAPAELERAVMARVNQFYAMIAKQQYRQAEAFVAEDTKDYYYAGAKPEIKKYEVLGVEFSQHLTHARVFTQCTEPVVMAGFPPTDMTVKVPTLWKIENGNWVLYEDPDKITNPSGLRRKIEAAVDGVVAATNSTAKLANDIPKDPAFALGKLGVDKTEVKIAPGGVEKVVVANGSAGPITLELGYPLKGIEAKLDRTEVGKGEKATLTLTAGKEPIGGFYFLRVVPTGEAIRLNVLVQQ